jgi:NADH:ubiquinone oxidoreductase subunit 2 (subunit N)
MIKTVGSNKIKDMAGLGSKTPLAALGFTVGAMGILGVPFFNGFVSKLMIVNSALQAEHILITVLILLATIIEIAYYLKVIQNLFFAKASNKIKNNKTKNAAHSYLPVLVLISLVFILGIYPELITGTLAKAANELVNSSNYITNVLGGM